jgi:hypothetical protein
MRDRWQFCNVWRGMGISMASFGWMEFRARGYFHTSAQAGVPVPPKPNFRANNLFT